jgi:hypothetical protein
MLDELELNIDFNDDDDNAWFFGRGTGGTDGEYWRKNYQRMVGYLHRFRELALRDTISIYEVSQLQQELDTALTYTASRERQVRERLKIKAMRDVTGREPEEAAAYLAKADQLERGTR